ncbi:hypothetical protein L5515_000098 [Caenorhabditis briggsae]|uniref:guanylate cyclase n=1 Tax=Caenorhabditis briggsae TaxID=6238 RepID=A0AAE9J1S6_CAEBR|nr:hypothetical protein L5515_000098 [Caenorhabditis briggsae]
MPCWPLNYFSKEQNAGPNLAAQKMSWKVSKDELKIIVNKNANTSIQKMSRELENKNSKEENPIISKRRVFGSYALVGTQRAEFLQFKQFTMIHLSPDVIDYLYTLKQLQNDNLAKFLGIQCNDDTMPTLTVLHTLVERGTLEEFCLNQDFSMNETFKSAFMRDMLRGLNYLHKGPIGYHGFLQAATCLIDINWVLKLSLYGVTNFICDALDNKNIQAPDFLDRTVSYAQYVCFPPEHIKQYDKTGEKPPRMVRGSQKGDMYSVGMILYMMIERDDPYMFSHELGRPDQRLVKDIIVNNKLPRIAEEHNAEALLLEKCKECWSRKPEERPDVRDIMDTISIVYASAKGSLVDQMMKINEKYAAELEDLVAIRTEELAYAKETTMKILNEMLPQAVAEDLKNGIVQMPRSYESATVMFVQICEFNVLMKKSTPDQVIAFLNDVFDQFDSVIKHHVAYKVETTGETYMVASGVPEENDGQHIFEIAEIALEIREVAAVYVLPHDPKYILRIRTGFHMGPIAAGVIGIKSPRYCLFGDTVNYASRMQSTCAPNQIQTSEITAKVLENSKRYILDDKKLVYVKGKGDIKCYLLTGRTHRGAKHVEEQN